MEPLWKQLDDPDTFDASQLCHCDSETLQFVYNQQNQLDNHISRQLVDNGLVDSSTMLDTEDSQDFIIDTDESFAFQEEEVIMEASTNVFDVDVNHDDDS
jgi:hypothetical protein